ncbi:N-acyl homoserine lactonase family protein [Allopusillimonas ginsengisoli]|uniref:N-acyl homoserine lactonase family protein n=1 Tax=Allopusillimonas ginsengisoli TaxID=453575 RepID=UPI001ADB62E2|nr:N-acyl homoserine lactonase family protein [Allopusillimonas ginsengisoli]
MAQTVEQTSMYEVYALKYATRSAQRSANFVGGDPHDGPMPLDYYVWVIRNRDRLILVDTGFFQDMADKRHRSLLRTPVQALELIGIQAADVNNIVITHMHNDHVGTFDAWPNARFHLQDAELDYATGRHMACAIHSRAYEPDHVAGLIRLAYKNRIVFHDGDGEIADGISVHRVGGHTAGMQVVRVRTARGWVVLASDASHFYEHIQTRRSFSLVFHIGDMFQGYARLEALAQTTDHIIPGHDPLVMEKYPPLRQDLAGIVARLDIPPITK